MGGKMMDNIVSVVLFAIGILFIGYIYAVASAIVSLGGA